MAALSNFTYVIELATAMENLSSHVIMECGKSPTNLLNDTPPLTEYVSKP